MSSRYLSMFLLCVVIVASTAADARSADDRRKGISEKACKVLADERLRQPLETIAEEYFRRTESRISINFLPAGRVGTLVQKGQTGSDLVLSMPKKSGGKTPVSGLAGAKAVAWKYPGGSPVWAAVLTNRPQAAGFFRFVGGPTGHRLWSESKAGFTITAGKTHAEAFDWVVRNRVGHTYPITAMRMLRECGGIREGICIDIGCGTGNLDVELARRSKLTIIGLDIDPDMKPLFDERVRRAGFEKRIRFVAGDAQKLPFADDFADMIVSRGTLTFIPDIGKCLREVDRVLKPTGMAFLGGRYVFTPQTHKISTEKLREIVRSAGVAGAQVIDSRGQWVKIVGPKAPDSARNTQGGPHLLVHRCIADYAITEGKCLLICNSDGPMQRGLQSGFLDMTDMKITAIYPSRKVAGEAEKRLRDEKLSGRVVCKIGKVHDLPFAEASFDLVAGVGPILLWGNREKGMREIYRVLRPGGAALIGGKFLHMPQHRKTSSETLRKSAANTGIPWIRISDDGVLDDIGQWVEIRKGIKDRGVRD